MARVILTCRQCGSRFDVSKFPPGSLVKCGRCAISLTVPPQSSESVAPAPADPRPASVVPGQSLQPQAPVAGAPRSAYFRGEAEAQEQVLESLSQAAPPGWRVERGGPGRATLEWRLVPEPGGAVPAGREFGVWVTHGLDLVVVTHGNSDAAAAGLGAMARMRATVIDCRALHFVDLAKLLLPVFRDEEPNSVGTD